jgi:serine/threonine-protein kinase RsbT
MRIDVEDDVVTVRKTVRTLAQELGFDAFANAAVTTASSELARNVWVHASRGHVVVEQVFDGQRAGIRAAFHDEGPGIADVPRVMQGGYSTARSMGLGLSGSRRLVDEFDVSTEVGRGTVVTFVKWGRR